MKKRLFRGKKRIVLPSEKNVSVGEKRMKIDAKLDENIKNTDAELCVQKNFDVVSRLFSICGRRACVYYIDGYVDDGTGSKFFETLQNIDD